ncbi:MAG: BtrH N-terminal domain-containing protein [Anaerolineae bacterium]|nr:BtrH N-terminal domain-containing protein [Anaerolineae bacterium]
MMILENYTQFGGIHPETATMTNVLASQGVTAPHTARPYSEAMILGIAGGIGCGYILWEFQKYDAAILVLGFQNKWNYPMEFMGNLCSRLGVQPTFLEATSPKKAGRQLEEVIADGRAAIAWVDQESLPYFHLRPMYNGCFDHLVTVYGLDENLVHVDDRAQKPLTVDKTAFATARARIGSSKNRLLLLDGGLAPLDLATAVQAGIADCVEYLSADSQTFAIPVFRKWARLMTDSKNKKGWPVVFQQKRGLYSTLRSLHEGIKLFGVKGGGLRLLYADFLEEAAAVWGGTAVTEAAAQYRTLGHQWARFADAVLPDQIAPLAQTRQLLTQKYAMYEQQGPDGQAEVASLSQQLTNLETELNSHFPISDEEMMALFADMQTHLNDIYQAELAALATLRACLQSK